MEWYQAFPEFNLLLTFIIIIIIIQGLGLLPCSKTIDYVNPSLVL
jgi:hypothetical protein